MKKIMFFWCAFLSLQSLYAQRFGFMDSESILARLPEYKTAQEALNEQSVTWQNEIEALQTKIIQQRMSLEAEKVLLTEEMKQEKEKAIQAQEGQLRQRQEALFGFEGQIFKKRQELMKPIQDKIFAAAQKVARKRKLSFIFDRSGDLVMVYADPTHDYTENVLEELGLKAE